MASSIVYTRRMLGGWLAAVRAGGRRRGWRQESESGRWFLDQSWIGFWTGKEFTSKKVALTGQRRKEAAGW